MSQGLSLEQSLDRYLERHGQASFCPKAFCFDMDGVLYDSMPHHERSWLEAAKSFGLQMSREDVYMCEGQTGRETIEQLVQRTHQRSATDEEKRAVYDLKTELFIRYNEGKVIPGIQEVLVATKGFRRLIVTGSSQASLLDKIERNFPACFSSEDIITGRNVEHGKPHPEPYLKALERAEVAPYEAVVVENAPRGVCSAHRAGCFTIAVNTGPLADDVLWQEGADLVLPDMFSLASLIEANWL